MDTNTESIANAACNHTLHKTIWDRKSASGKKLLKPIPRRAFLHAFTTVSLLFISSFCLYSYFGLRRKKARRTHPFLNAPDGLNS